MLDLRSKTKSNGTLRVTNDWELRVLFVVVIAVFAVFFVMPLVLVAGTSLMGQDGSLTVKNYTDVFSDADFVTSIFNSLKVSLSAAFVSVALAFLLAYTVNCTNIPNGMGKAVTVMAQMPMLLPTITYGFAIIYSFGRQGFLTELLGFQPFDIYGFNGLLIGYVLYTLPTAFLLINNGFQFVDKRFMIVSRIMGDSSGATFLRTIVQPLAGSLGTAFILAFFLSFTDYGIPTSVGGEYNVIALELYGQMLGAVPDFNRGAVIAVVMLVPSLLSIAATAALDRHAVRYDRISPVEIPVNRIRDVVCAVLSVIVLACMLSVFAVIVVVPFMQMWPFKPYFTFDHVMSVFTDGELGAVFVNSLIVAAFTAVLGCLVAYAAALITTRSSLHPVAKRLIDSLSSVVNTVPGMVLGVAYLFAFAGGPIQGTFAILVLCNIVHYFATPYQMMKDALSKMNSSWETTARLMGDSWIKTIVRVITPNALPSILQVFGYYFVNAMVTISAVVFLTGAHTMVVTTKISALQHVADFDSIFVLSLFILAVNLAVKGAIAFITRPRKERRAASSVSKSSHLGKPDNMMTRRRAIAACAALMLGGVALFSMTKGHSKSVESTAGKIVIASNADEEAIAIYKAVLDENGYANRYIVQSFGTSELGGKLMAEGIKMEADVVTMSSYYLDSAQDRNGMFADLADVEAVPLTDTPTYRRAVQALEGAIFYNVEVLDSEGLPIPESLRDLADPVYEGMVSLPDISGSSTGWIMVLALIDSYGEDEAKEILAGIYRNAGPYLSQSGSAPIKNVRVGEVAIGFGLRHQAIADKADGLPIECVDPLEGSYILTESVAVVNKGVNIGPEAQKVAALLVDAARPEIMQIYAPPLYEGESVADAEGAKEEGSDDGAPVHGRRDFREFSEPLTVDLLKYHQRFSEECKRNAAS